MAKAHEGMTKDPSKEVGGICANCHDNVSQNYENSLHAKQHGFVSALETFSKPGVLDEKDSGQKFVFDNNCASCHATCGQCHVSRPNAAKGGLLSGHSFEKKPPMDKTCVGCHSSRNGAEYIGEIGINADVHYEKGKDCTFCHQEDNFHGTGANEASEWSKMTTLPKCTDCHQEVVSGKSKVAMHNVHPKDTLSCQVCHASTNNNCYSCHVTVNGQKIASQSEPELMFKIGINPDRNELHPEKYITLRHIPTLQETFDAVDKNLLPNFDQVPNWKHSPTHNIQRFTPQNASCDACHGNQKLFLTKDDLRSGDSKANEKLLVPKIPEKMGS